MKTTTASLVLVTFLAISWGNVSAQTMGDVYLSNVTGLTPDGKISTSLPGGAIFTINYRNTGTHKVCMTNGFEISGTGGVTWFASYWEDAGFPTGNFDLAYDLHDFSWDGVGADTIGHYGVSLSGNALPPDFDGPAFHLNITPTAGDVGDTICIDSCWFPNTGVWLWQFVGLGLFPPSWSGPHCYEVTANCCYNRGDFDHSGGNPPIHIHDLVGLVDYMFKGGPPPVCPEEGDMNGSGSSVLDVADLSYLVDFMFLGGAPPPPCD